MGNKTDDIPSKEPRKQTRKRLSFWMPMSQFEDYKELDTGSSLQSVVKELLTEYLLNLQLKAEFSKLK